MSAVDDVKPEDFQVAMEGDDIVILHKTHGFAILRKNIKSGLHVEIARRAFPKVLKVEKEHETL